MFILFGEIAVTVCLHLTATAYFWNCQSSLWHLSVSSTLWRNSIHKLHPASNCFACWEAHVKWRIADVAPVLYLLTWPCIFSDTHVCCIGIRLFHFVPQILLGQKKCMQLFTAVFISSLRGTGREVGLCPIFFYRLYCNM